MTDDPTSPAAAVWSGLRPAVRARLAAAVAHALAHGSIRRKDISRIGEVTVTLELPSNEAVRAAVAAGAGISALSRSVVEASLADGQLVALPFDLPAREFLVVGAVQRHVSRAADAFLRHLIPDQGA